MNATRRSAPLCLLLASAGCGATSGPASSGALDPPAAPTVAARAPLAEQFAWLVGSWVAHDEAGRITEEHWLAPHPELLLGWNRTLEDGRVTAIEHLVLLRFGDEVSYQAWPSGQAPAGFALVESQDGRALFADPLHDFPQRIVYERAGDELRAAIEGDAGAGPQRMEWTFHPQPLEPSQEGQFTDRVVAAAVEVAAPPAEVFARWTTEDGVRTFFAPDAQLEPAPGGAYQLYFDPAAPEGSRGSEGCIIVELVPDRRLVVTWNFPPSLPTLRDGRTLVTVELEPLDGGRTRVTLRQVGFRRGAEWDEGFAYFERAWNLVLERLAASFVQGPIDWSAP